MIRWASTEIRGSEISKKDWEVDGFGTRGNLLRGKRRFGKRETTRDGEKVREYMNRRGIRIILSDPSPVHLSAERDIIRSRM